MEDDGDCWIRRAAEMRKAAYILLERAAAVEAMSLPPSTIAPITDEGRLPVHRFRRHSSGR